MSTTPTYSFSPNTKIKSAEVNQNFNDVLTHYGFAVYMSTDQDNIANTTWQIVYFENAIYDPYSLYNTGTHVFTVPAGKDGKWFLHACYQWESGTTLTGISIGIKFDKNTGTDLATKLAAPVGTGAKGIEISSIPTLVAGDTIVVRAYHANGDAVPDIDGIRDRTVFEGYFLGT